MKHIMAWIADHPVIMLVVIGLITLGFASQLPKIKIDSSAEGMMVEGDPERLTYDKAKEKFGSDDLTVVIVKTKDTVFSERVLNVIKRITDEIDAIDEVKKIVSLTSVNNIKGEGEFLNTEQLIVEVPTDLEEIQTIRENALQNNIFVGNIVSSDGKIAAINAYTEAGGGYKGKIEDDGESELEEDLNEEGEDEEESVSGPEVEEVFNARFFADVDNIIKKEKEGTDGEIEIYQLGNPMLKASFVSSIDHDQKTVTPICFAVIFIVLYACFRTPRGIIIPLVTTSLSIVWTFGFMAIVGIPLNVMTVIVPALLIAIGCTEDVHMMSEYYSILDKGGDKSKVVKEMAVHCGLPNFLTGMTTFLGFATLCLNKIPIVKQFGMAASFGMAAGVVITLSIVPTILNILKHPKIKPKKTVSLYHIFRIKGRSQR